MRSRSLLSVRARTDRRHTRGWAVPRTSSPDIALLPSRASRSAARLARATIAPPLSGCRSRCNICRRRHTCRRGHNRRPWRSACRWVAAPWTEAPWESRRTLQTLRRRSASSSRSSRRRARGSRACSRRWRREAERARATGSGLRDDTRGERPTAVAGHRESGSLGATISRPESPEDTSARGSCSGTSGR